VNFSGAAERARTWNRRRRLFFASVPVMVWRFRFEIPSRCFRTASPRAVETIIAAAQTRVQPTTDEHAGDFHCPVRLRLNGRGAMLLIQ